MITIKMRRFCTVLYMEVTNLHLVPSLHGKADGESVETVSDFTFWGSKITADGDCSREVKRRLLLGRKL